MKVGNIFFSANSSYILDTFYLDKVYVCGGGGRV